MANPHIERALAILDRTLRASQYNAEVDGRLREIRSELSQAQSWSGPGPSVQTPEPEMEDEKDPVVF